MHSKEATTILPEGATFPEVVQYLTNHESYAANLERVFKSEENKYDMVRVVDALAAFLRSFESRNSPYDSYMKGDEGAMSIDAIEGMNLFHSKRLGCSSCHGGENFDTPADSADHFVNTGLYNYGAGPFAQGLDNDYGLYNVTFAEKDRGKFRIPSLRNLSVTGPYMHDGSIGSIEAVVEHYNRGGMNISENGVGGRAAGQDSKVRRLDLKFTERRNLIAFLNALTDEEFVRKSIALEYD